MSLTKYILLGCFFILVSASLLSAQSGNNPFEIESRLTEDQKKDTPTANPFDVETTNADTTTIVIDKPSSSTNPFELESRKSENVTIEATDRNPFEKNIDINQPVFKPKQEEKKEQPAREGKSAGNFMFWTMLVNLLLLTILATLYRSYITKVYRSFLNENFLKLVHREKVGDAAFPFYFFYLFFFINAGIFIYLLLDDIQPGGPDGIYTLLSYIGIVAGLFITKHIVLNILAATFPIKKSILQYSFMIIIFSIILGLFLVPVNILLAFAPEGFTRPVIYIAIACIALIYLFRAFRGLFLSSKFISMHKFHFFMYLCTVEIAPFAVLLKLIFLGTGIH